MTVRIIGDERNARAKRSGTGRLLAFLTPVPFTLGEPIPGRADGPVLCVSGQPFTQEISAGGRKLVSDLAFAEGAGSESAGCGLQVFEGWVELVEPDDPDSATVFVGQWRGLTFWETCLVREGRSPWT